jgi:hypothetical protein
MNLFEIYRINRMLKAGPNVFYCDVRIIIRDDFRERTPFTNKFEHVLDGNPVSSDARFSEMNVWIDCNSRGHGRCPGFLS